MNNNCKSKKELNMWLRIVLIMLSLILGVVVIALIFNPHEGDFVKIRIASIMSKIIAIIIVYTFTIYIDKKAIDFLGIKWKENSFKLCLIGCFIALLQFLFVVINGLIFNVTICENLNTNVNSVLIGTSIFFIHCIFVALSEEMLFRGYILGNLLMKMNERKAVIISSIIFFSVHYSSMGNILYYIDCLLMGVIFAYMYILSRSLYLPMGIHFMTDFLQYMILLDSPQNPYYLMKFKISNNINLGGLNLGPKIELIFIISDILILLSIIAYKRGLFSKSK